MVLFSTTTWVWFYFPLYPQIDFVFHYTLGMVLISTMVLSILFSTMPIFPPCFTLWVNPPCFTLWGLVGRARSCPFVVVHGMATLRPTKVKDGIFKPVAGRYIFCSGVTWLEN
jgi:hypothetical protein